MISIVRQISQSSKTFLKIGQNTGILFMVNVVGAVIGFLMAAALGRGLGDSGFGQYTLVMTWLVSLTLLTEFGLSTVITRDVAAKPNLTQRYVINSLAAKLLLSGPGTLLLLFFPGWLSLNQDPQVIAALQWGVLFFYSGLCYSSFTAIFKAHQIMTPILWLTLAGQLALFAGTLLLLLWQQPLFTLIAWHGVTQSLQCGLAFMFYGRLIVGQKQRNSKELGGTHSSRVPAISMHSSLNTHIYTQQIRLSQIKTLIATAWPFALAGILAALQMRANIFILAYLQGDQALGWYAAANRFVETGKQLPGAFYAAILPALAAMAAYPHQHDNLQKTLRQARLGLLAFALAAALGALLLARPILTLTYGSAYQPATTTLQILTLSLVPATQNSLFIVYFYARNDERFVNLLIAVGIVINLGLCAWLIPVWGPAGTALALLLADAALYVLYQQRMAHHL